MMQADLPWPRLLPTSCVGGWLHQRSGCALRPRRAAEVQLRERQLAPNPPTEGRSQRTDGMPMRLDGRNELERQLAAAEQR